MGHFQNVRLKQHKGLRGVTLYDLKKINVLCGPNNSGKTTILECIAEPKLRSTGIPLDDASTKQIEATLMAGREWREGRMAKHFSQAIIEAAGRQSAWFEDEDEGFLEVLLELWRLKYPNSTFSERGVLMRAFHGQFSSPSVILIPAKRRLETSKAVGAFDVIHADGTGILNFLFAAKNQDEHSATRGYFNSICTAFRDISGGYEFDLHIQTAQQNISPPPTIIDLKFRGTTGSWIPAVDCGLGLQELIIFLYFGLASAHDVVLIEEPENHLHPEIQRNLIRFLGERSGKQFVLSTHSSVFLNTQFADRIFTSKMEDGVQVANATSRASLLTELGYSIADNLVSDLIILCEGPKDKPVLDEFLQKSGLGRYNIKVWPLGGDIMDQLDLSVFKENHRLIAIVDGDPGSSKVRNRFQKKCEDLKIPITRLQRYALENYFSLPAISAAMETPIPTEIQQLDPNRRVSDQLGFEVKRNGGKIARAMTLQDIEGTDLAGFLGDVATLLNGAIRPIGSESTADTQE